MFGIKILYFLEIRMPAILSSNGEDARTYVKMLNSFDIIMFEPINEGLSDDIKYYVETTDSMRMLLRVAGAIWKMSCAGSAT